MRKGVFTTVPSERGNGKRMDHTSFQKNKGNQG